MGLLPPGVEKGRVLRLRASEGKLAHSVKLLEWKGSKAHKCAVCGGKGTRLGVKGWTEFPVGSATY